MGLQFPIQSELNTDGFCTETPFFYQETFEPFAPNLSYFRFEIKKKKISSPF